MASSTAVRAPVRALKRLLPNNQPPISLTTSAVSRINQLSQQQNNKGVKIGIQIGECNGLTYTINHIDEITKYDQIVDQDGVRVVIDPKAQFSLLGSQIDYVEDKLRCGFVFNNPNVTITRPTENGESFLI